MDLQHQLTTVHIVAATFWERDLLDITDALDGITVIKRTGGKIMGFFPEFEQFPPVFFKVYNNNAFKYEMEGLQAAHAMPQVPGVQVPQVIRVFPDHKAILTAKRDWKDTTTPIKRFFVGSLGIDWVKVGRWLRAFHDTRVTHERNDKFLRRNFKKIESQIDKLQSLFTPEQLVKMRVIISDAKDYFESANIEWVFSHGDFGLANIKISDNTLEIIDFENCQMAPREFDILNCLVRLEYTRYFPNQSKQFRAILLQFLKGYRMTLPQTLVYEFIYLLIKLELIETYFRRKNDYLCINHRKWIFIHFLKVNLSHLKNWLDNITL